MIRFGVNSLVSRRLLGSVAVGIVVALLVTGAVVWLGNGEQKSVVAYFERTTGLYEGDEVRIVGIQVGEIDSIEFQGERMRVEFHYDAQYQVPADARALIVAPTLVTARFIQLAPGYRGGPMLADGAVIPMKRTAVPVEWDQIKQQLSKLATSLGPKGLNADGSLSRVLDVAAANLDGQGRNLHQTLQGLSKAIETLSTSRGNLFGTVRNLQVFVSALARSGEQIVQFSNRLASVSDLLENNREELGAALSELTVAIDEVEQFVRTNRGELRTTVSDLTELSQVLAEQRSALRQVLHVAPTALADFYNIYTPVRGSLAGALGAVNFQSPTQFACSAIAAAGSMRPEQAAKTCADYLGPLLRLLAINYPPIGLNPLVRNGSEPVPNGEYVEDGGSSSSAPSGPSLLLDALPGAPDLGGLLVPGGGR